MLTSVRHAVRRLLVVAAAGFALELALLATGSLLLTPASPAGTAALRAAAVAPSAMVVGYLALATLAMLTWLGGRRLAHSGAGTPALTVYRLGLATAALARDPVRSALHSDVALALRGRGDIAGAVAEHRAALATLRASAAVAVRTIALVNLGGALAEVGELDEASSRLDEALHIAPTPPLRAAALVNLGWTRLAADDVDGATARFSAAEAAALADEGAADMARHARRGLASAALDAGDAAEALRRAGEVAADAAAAGDERVLSGALEVRGRAHLALGDAAAAEADLVAARAAADRGRDPDGVARLDARIGLLLAQRGERGAARRRLVQPHPGCSVGTRTEVERLRVELER